MNRNGCEEMLYQLLRVTPYNQKDFFLECELEFKSNWIMPTEKEDESK